jgi:hypothetical protein
VFGDDPSEVGAERRALTGHELIHFVSHVNGTRLRRDYVWSLLDLARIDVEYGQGWGLGYIFVAKASTNRHSGSHLNEMMPLSRVQMGIKAKSLA